MGGGRKKKLERKFKSELREGEAQLRGYPRRHPSPDNAGVVHQANYSSLTDGLRRSILRMIQVASIRYTARYWGVSRATVRKIRKAGQSKS